MNDTNNTVTAINSNEVNGTTTTAGMSYTVNPGQYCWERLPCGICIRTNQMCPIAGGNYPIITWTANSTTEGCINNGK